jgi:hypothetical protein
MVMLAAEESKDPYELVDPKFEGHNETEISYHIALLDDAGLLHGQDRSAIGVFRWSAGALTWAGHEFVEAVRDDSVWKEARAITAKSGDGTVFEILNKALMQVLEKRTGLEKSA